MHEKYNIQMHEKHIDKLSLFSKRGDHNAKHYIYPLHTAYPP